MEFFFLKLASFLATTLHVISKKKNSALFISEQSKYMVACCCLGEHALSYLLMRNAKKKQEEKWTKERESVIIQLDVMEKKMPLSYEVPL